MTVLLGTIGFTVGEGAEAQLVRRRIATDLPGPYDDVRSTDNANLSGSEHRS